jgi:hypothetical protein
MREWKIVANFTLYEVQNSLNENECEGWRLFSHNPLYEAFCSKTVHYLIFYKEK